MGMGSGGEELSKQRPGFFVKRSLGSAVFQGEVAEILEVAAVVLGPKPGLGVIPGNAFPGHKPGNPVLPGGGDGYGVLAKLRQPALEESDGVNGGQDILE